MNTFIKKIFDNLSNIVENLSTCAIILFFSIPIIILYASIFNLCDGNFTYTLDDPYIHLELAKNIMHGNYGINLNEFSAPSSSILWPFFLAPFSSLTEWYEIIPAIINSICTIGIGLLLFNIFSSKGKFLGMVVSITIMLSTNVYGLIFSGMEHSLQCFLAVACCYFILNFEKIEFNHWQNFLFYLCLFLLPLIRYEGMAISFPTLAYLFIKKRKKPAVIIYFLFYPSYSLVF